MNPVIELENITRKFGDLVAVDAADSGVGDVAIHVGRRLVGRDRHPRRRLALRAQLKAPTGDSDRLFGSGGWDVALWLQAQHQYHLQALMR